jgi:hypothetical protein
MGVVEERKVLKKEVQLTVISVMSDATVALSATMWKVERLFEKEEETKVAVDNAPPGRDVLSGRPYC